MAFQIELPATGEVQIRPTAPDDLPGVARVSVDTWRGTYGGLLPAVLLDRLRYRSQEHRHRGFLARSGVHHRIAAEVFTDEVVGFANGGPGRHPHLGPHSEIYELYVQAGYQGRAIGRGLFDAMRLALAAEGKDSLVVWVLASNPNRAFYDRLGGRRISQHTIRMAGAKVDEIAYAWSL